MVVRADSLQTELNVTEALIDGVIRRASGQYAPECSQNYPRDVYFLGNLRSRLDGVGRTLLPGELMSKLSPFALGAELLLAASEQQGAVMVTLRWSVYYRVFPTYEQQKQHQYAQTDVGQPAAGRRRSLHAGDSLALRFKRIDASASGRIDLTMQEGSWPLDCNALQSSIDAEHVRCQQVVLQDPDRYRARGKVDEKTRVPDLALQSESAFLQFLSGFRVEVLPDWRIEPLATGRRDSHLRNGVVFSLDVTNATGPMQNPNIEFFLFNVQMELRPEGWGPRPFRIELAPKGFRYSRDMWGKGFNCALEKIEPGLFKTAHTPIFRQARYVTQNDPPAPFAGLAANPIPILRNIEKAMRAYRQKWIDARTEYASRNPCWELLHGQEFDRDSSRFDQEIIRFSSGIDLLEADADCRTAFCLTNETFRRLGESGPLEKRKDQWRLFQIVFLVSQIPGLFGLKASTPERDAELATVDVIYFPTGGGKTEAYLGVIAFHCFFDRLRGKTAGVTCWTRFPLRLLTLQQTQRMAEVIGIADLVRRESSDARLSARSIDPFAVGYFVGQEGTPNKLVPPQNGAGNRNARDAAEWSKATDPDERQGWKRVVACPSCRSNSIVVDFDEDAVRIAHRCTQPRCKFPGGVLPVYVTDNEIFRYLPAVIVGTVDKLAAIGNQRKFSQLLGSIEGQCSKHGYYHGVCTQEGCRDKRVLIPGRPKGLSGPTLFVQDELHLLKEGLGTFDSHYETFIQKLSRVLGNPRPIKIMASSATIEQFERQVEHLYGKDRAQARIFPELGPRLTESFYAKTLEEPQRIFVGLLPHNKTQFNAILELIEYYHLEAMELRRTSPAALSDWYQTSLTYFLKNQRLHAVRPDLESDTNVRLQELGYSPLQLQELTGDTSTDEVTRTLHKLETPLRVDEAADAVLANQMVSHGVDIDRLNAMIFYGMPRLTAEYIQASSRVGRSHIGVVFLCHESARERDQSHFLYFQKYHEYLGQLVEPVAINRWASYSVVRTLPGLFMAVLLQMLSGRLGLKNPNMIYMRNVVQQKISTGEIRAADFEQLLREAYLQIGGGDAGSRARFERQIPLRIRQFMDQILQPGGSDTWVSGALIPRPMNSLRDVEEAIPIELDAEGSDWGRR